MYNFTHYNGPGAKRNIPLSTEELRQHMLDACNKESPDYIDSNVALNPLRKQISELIQDDPQFKIPGFLRKDPEKRNALAMIHYACIFGFSDICQILITRRPNNTDLTNPTIDGITPLFFAAYYGHIEICTLLIMSGASINASDVQGCTPLHLAALQGMTECARLLIASSANLESTTTQGWTPLHLAAAYGMTECVTLLIASGATIDAANAEGFTPLHRAAANGKTECVTLLIPSGATINAANAKGATPLHLAARYRKTECAILLIASGANINAANAEGFTLLNLAAYHGHTDLLSYLLLSAPDLIKNLNHTAVLPNINITELIKDNLITQFNGYISSLKYLITVPGLLNDQAILVLWQRASKLRKRINILDPNLSAEWLTNITTYTTIIDNAIRDYKYLRSGASKIEPEYYAFLETNLPPFLYIINSPDYIAFKKQILEVIAFAWTPDSKLRSNNITDEQRIHYRRLFNSMQFQRAALMLVYIDTLLIMQRASKVIQDLSSWLIIIATRYFQKFDHVDEAIKNLHFSDRVGEILFWTNKVSQDPNQIKDLRLNSNTVDTLNTILHKNRYSFLNRNDNTLSDSRGAAAGGSSSSAASAAAAAAASSPDATSSGTGPANMHQEHADGCHFRP